MSPRGFAVFETPVGHCGLAWGDRGIAGVQLPEGSEPETRARVRSRFPDASEAEPPPEVRRAIADIVALLRGKKSDLSAIPLDMHHVPPFHRRVYELARTIPPGATLSYGEVASRLGSPGSARAVGQALRKNPFTIIVPCHRVLAAGGKAGGFTANGGVSTKLRLLALEGHRPAAAPALFAGEAAFDFDTDVAVRHLRGSDAALGRLIDTVGPFRMQLAKTPNLFVALSEAIVYQQLTGKAAATIFGRVRALFPDTTDGPTAPQILRAKEETLRSVGLSGPKLLSLKDLARRTEAGELPTFAEIRGMDNDTIIERLTQVRGIGQWTVEMLLMFRLGRPDVLPVGDYGIRKGFAVAFRKRELPSPKDVERRGARWKPYRTVASWYLWRAAELAKKP